MTSRIITICLKLNDKMCNKLGLCDIWYVELFLFPLYYDTYYLNKQVVKQFLL